MTLRSQPFSRGSHIRFVTGLAVASRKYRARPISHENPIQALARTRLCSQLLPAAAGVLSQAGSQPLPHCRNSASLLLLLTEGSRGQLTPGVGYQPTPDAVASLPSLEGRELRFTGSPALRRVQGLPVYHHINAINCT